MTTLALAALLAAVPSCITRYDDGLRRHLTECRDGSRAITRYDEGLKRLETQPTKPPDLKPGKPRR